MSDNHFLYYAARLQDAGVRHLSITLDVDRKGFRVMHVVPRVGFNASTASAVYAERSFQLTGSDPELQQIEDDLVYGEGGVTPERVAAAIRENPVYAPDLTEFAERWKANDLDDAIAQEMEREPTAEELAAAEVTHERLMQFVKGLQRGLDGKRGREVSRR
jgi:hypothetical protein